MRAHPLYDPSLLAPTFRRPDRVASMVVLATGLVGLGGRLLHLPVLVSVFPDMPPMSVPTALCLILLGGALRLLQSQGSPVSLCVCARILAALACVVAVLMAFDRLPGVLGGRMTPNAVGTIILSASALFSLNSQRENGRRPAQWIAVLVILSGLWTLLGYVFGVASFGRGSTGEMAIHTAAAFIVFGLGVLFTHPTSGVMAIFSRSSAAGAMARTILPASILMLFAIAAATVLGFHSGLYSQAVNNVLFTIGSIILFALMVWQNARAIDKIEQERQRAVEAARGQREWLHVMLFSIADAVVATDQTGRVQFLNPVAETLTGWAEDEAVGVSAADVFRLCDIQSGKAMDASPVARVLKDGAITGPQEFATLVARNGKEIPIEAKAAPIRNSQGQLVGCVVVFRDITERRRAEEMRLEVGRQYSAIAEAIPQIVWTAQAGGSVDFFNQRWLDYTGLDLAQSQGWDWQSALHPEDIGLCVDLWRRSIASVSEFEVEVRIRRCDEVCRWHLIRALPVLDRMGRVSKWFGTCTDIDDQKRAEESMRFLADASTVLSASLEEIETLNSIAQLAVPKIADLCTVHLVIEDQLQLAAVSHMDPRKVDLRVQIDRRFPPSLERAVGIADVVLTGRATLTPEIDEWHLDGMATDECHGVMLRELGLRSMMCVPLPGHHSILGVITLASTESGRRYATHDLALAEEVARRTALALDNNRLFAEVTETKVEAEAANAAKDQFLAVLSHELRTPLTPVLLSVEELSRDRSLPAPVREAMEMTRRNIELEARLIDDLLDLTRIQRGKLQLHRSPTDVHALLRNAIEICSADIGGKNLHLSFGLSATRHYVDADPARLQQVFWNLIKNAVKFTDSGGSIVFRSRNMPNGGTCGIQIEIEDSGIGIDASFLPKIFNAFEQGEKSRTRRFGGLGLGLAITKNLVEAHGGSICVHSPGRDLGAKFVIELNTMEPFGGPQTDVPVPEPEGHRGAGLRILLVEDNPDTGELLRKILERRGYHVDLFTTIKTALDFAGQVPFDLLVSDVGLPDGSGLELMQSLRKKCPIPGIAMSGFGMDEDVQRSREAGFSEHLTKPISIRKLEEAIQRLTEHRRGIL